MPLNTEPIPAPDPATPTVAAPAPMYLAAMSISRLATLVWKFLSWLIKTFVLIGATVLSLLKAVQLIGLMALLPFATNLEAGVAILAQAYMFVGFYVN